MVMGNIIVSCVDMSKEEAKMSSEKKGWGICPNCYAPVDIKDNLNKAKQEAYEELEELV